MYSTQSKRKDIYQAYVKSLVEQGLAYPCFMTEEELGGAKRVLTAAALTYVAAMVTAILQLVRLLLLTNRRR